MAQQHMDRLTAVDAGFLHQEGRSTHMHIGGVMVFDGPSPGHAELQQHIAGRLPLVPRYRQKLASVPAGLGVAGLRDLATLPLRTAALATHPERALEEAGHALGSVAEVARTVVFEPAPPSPLNVPITPHRRLAFVTARLDDFKAVKNAF